MLNKNLRISGLFLPGAAKLHLLPEMRITGAMKCGTASLLQVRMNLMKNEMNNGKESVYNDVAVLIPCLNEEKTIGKAVNEFRTTLPGARVFVFDNASSDKTSIIAKEAGATVIYYPIRGKGNVVRYMFSVVEADIYIKVDGDDTYPVSSAPDMIAEFKKSNADMLVGVRVNTFKEGSFRRFHYFGNRLISYLISILFSGKITDALSGYRVMSNTFVKSIPLISENFEVETEMTLQSLSKNYIVKEIPIQYGKRPQDSHSKLNTFSDGLLILKSIFLIFKDYKPLTFFFILSLSLLIVTIFFGIWPISDYIKTRSVTHVPLAILATGIGILSALSMGIGLILDTIKRYHNETFEVMRRLQTKKMKVS